MRDDLDLLLNKALKQYTAAEPSPELAGRILRQTQSDAASRSARPIRERRVLAFALPAAAALGFALVLAFVLAAKLGLPGSPAARKHAAATVQLPAPAQPADSRNSEAAIVTKASLERPHLRNAEPKSRKRVPSAGFYVAPPSPEERALVEFVEQHPKEAAEIAEEQKHALDPLQQAPLVIDPIQIKPITIAAIN